MMATLRDFLAMGGYASFVWPAYAVAAIVLAGVSLHSLAAYRRCQRELARLQQVRSRRGSAA
jgi:heme exporter protein D